MNGARASLEALCEESGIADLEEARVAAAARIEAERTKTEAATAIRQDLRGLTLDALPEKVERFAPRIAAYAATRAADSPLAPDLESAQAQASSAEDAVTALRSELVDRDAEADLAAEDPDSLDALLGNARASKARSAAELRQNEERRRDLRVMLDLQGEQGLAQQLDEAKTQLEHVEREHERLEARAEAGALLYETFAARRAEAHHRYVAPFREHIDQLGRIVFGSTLEVELDDELRVARRTLDGVTTSFDQLSTGAPNDRHARFTSPDCLALLT